MAQSHGEVLHFHISFRQGSSYVDPNIPRNALEIASFKAKLDSLTKDNLYTVRSIEICATTSPEGRYNFNQRLSQRRAANIRTFLQKMPSLESAIYRLDAPGIAWDKLADHIQNSADFQYRQEVMKIIEEVPEIEILADGSIYQKRRRAIEAIDGGKAYKMLHDSFFHELRGAQAQVTCVLQLADIPAMDSPADSRAHLESQPTLERPQQFREITVTSPDAAVMKEKSRTLPLLAIKTNLLFDFGTFYPGYGWAPSPNIAIEYYPRKGHWTVGASFDCPWWKKPQEHKYFQVRNYQIEARRYFRKADGSTSYKKVPYAGWYLSAYAHAGLFGIGLSDRVGGQGEGVGAGLGVGYVVPISRSGHWKLEFNVQAGYSYAWYDRYVYGDPVTEELNGLYYFDWIGNADDFVPRMYRRSWIGPTRVGVTLSYDIFKYKRKEARR